MIFEFPQDFFWGTATSAHQVSGNNHNDMTEWEKLYCQWLADQAKDPKSKWEPWQRERFPEMFDPANYISGAASDHYNRFEEDFDLAKNMTNNAHRFSIEWSRIEPQPGVFDQKQIDHYREIIQALKKRGIEPFVCLWHYTSPLWLYEKHGSGGWDKAETADRFARYAKKIAEEFKDEVKYWVILNEFEVIVAATYLTNLIPPKKINPLKALKMAKNFVQAHKKAYAEIKKISPSAQVGTAKNFGIFRPVSKNLIDRSLTKVLHFIWNRWLLRGFLNELDFIGLNIYDVIDVSWKKIGRAKWEKVNDLGYALIPEAVYDVIMDSVSLGKPLYVTEVGLADSKDQYRPWYLTETIKNVARAMRDGANVRGYFHWSLIDNFEWNKGFWPRYGLVEVDYKTFERKPRPSSKIYGQICLANCIDI